MRWTLWRRRERRRANEAEPSPARLPRRPERPPIPEAHRVNRNALTVVAVIMGTLVLAAVVLVQPTRIAPSAPASTPPAPVLPPGTWADQPGLGHQGGAPRPSAHDTGDLAHRDNTIVRAQAPDAVRPSGINRSGGALIGQLPGDAVGYPVLVRPPRPRHSELETDVALREAMLAPLRASEFAAASERSATRQVDWSMLTPDEPPGTAAMPPAAASPATTLTPPEPRVPVDSPHAPPGNATAPIAATVQPSPGALAIQAGTLIPAVLLTGIDSDLPGEVLAQVSRDVYDSQTMRELLIPRGSRLIGRCEDRSANGQDRILVAWTRIVFPDGRSVRLPSLETKDRAGASGVRDEVDRHTRHAFGTAAILSVLAAGVQLSQPRGAVGSFGVYATPQQVAAAAVGQELAQVATQMLRRDLDVRPTIRIRQGMPFNVFLGADVTFPAPYAETRP